LGSHTVRTSEEGGVKQMSVERKAHEPSVLLAHAEGVMTNWLIQHYRNISEAELLNEALQEWQEATGAQRVRCRRAAEGLLMQMQREKHAGRAALHRAFVRTQTGAVR
jgi:hypothetical protein